MTKKNNILESLKEKITSTENKKTKQLEHNGAFVELDNKQLQTEQGVLVEDTDNSLKAGPQGPVVMEDFIIIQKN